MHRSQYEYDFGCVGWMDITRLQFSDFIYDYQPLIDRHNQERQIIINILNVSAQRIICFLFLQLFLKYS